MTSKTFNLSCGVAVRCSIGDITQCHGDVVVNAVNQWLVPGGGVDGAIRSAASDNYHTSIGKPIVGLKQTDTFHVACEKIGYVPYGRVVKVPVPQGASLSFKDVYLFSAPPYEKSRVGQCSRLTREAYEQSFMIAENDGRESIFFPAIGTGVYNVPVVKAVEWAIDAIEDFQESFKSVKLINFVLFDIASLYIYRGVFEDTLQSGGGNE
jgi:O-acetyl-ADP-ribose deacetylase (regulator of RNase III)